jgi:serine/threonine protein kinase
MAFVNDRLMAVMQLCERGKCLTGRGDQPQLSSFPICTLAGSLQSFLQSKPKEATLGRLSGFALSCTECVSFLHSHDVIHRDIAARNFLLTASLGLKMSDFGMSKIGSQYYGNYHTAVAVRWSSPEVIERQKFSKETDRWALGVTLWEIFSFGARPYDDMTNLDVADKVMSKELKLTALSEIPEWAFAIITGCKSKKVNE